MKTDIQEIAIRRQIKVIAERLKTEHLSPETIRALNQKMREYKMELEKVTT